MSMFNPSQFTTIEQIEAFLNASNAFSLNYTIPRKEKAQWLRNRLLHFHYRDLSRSMQGLLRKFFMIITGYSPAQISRHIKTYRNGEPVCRKQKRHCFPVTYTPKDIELLAETDNLHGRINGAATTKIMKEEYARGDLCYERLKDISVSRLYDFRGSVRYRECSTTYERTQSVQTPIGERKKPQPKGEPGFIRTDTVHQGDKDGKKGVYHINNVDEITQWEVIVAVENIKESSVEPALDEAFELFPFIIKNFHSDNGGEYINNVVQQFLKRWKTKQTKSRPLHSNDNGLAETKNGAIIRKHMTHHHIPQPFAARINKFYREHLIPYINFHRPCAFPKVEILSNGKKKVTYPKENYMTPYEKLKSLPKWEQYLRSGVTPVMLEEQANAKTPNEAARDMKKAKEKLLNIIIPRHGDL